MKLNDIIVVEAAEYTTHEGSISKAALDDMIKKVREKYDIQADVSEIRSAVLDDYKESDIGAVTPRNIVEIIDASGIE